MAKATFGLEENVASAACYVLTWVTGIIFFIVEKDNKTVRFHAMQSILTFFPLTIIYWLISSIFYGMWFIWGMWFIFWIISMLIALLIFILWLFLMYKAYKGEKYLVPIVGAIAENQVK